MAKIHDLFIVELAEVIKGYGNDPDVEDPFRLSEFYRFYELPNIAVSRENFEKMRPLWPERNPDATWNALSKVYNMQGVSDEAKSIIGDVMLNLEEPERETGEVDKDGKMGKGLLLRPVQKLP